MRTCPRITSETSSPDILALFKASLMATAPRSSALKLDKPPLKEPVHRDFEQWILRSFKFKEMISRNQHVKSNLIYQALVLC